MKKVYYINEAQYKALLESKREQKRTFNAICEEIAQKKKTLTEATLLNEGVIDTIKSYAKKGLLTVALVASLLSANQVNAQQLSQAGVPKATIEQAMDKVKYNPSQMSNKQIEDRLIQIMKKNNLKGSLADFQKLNPQQKENILNGIKSKIKSLDDINHITIGNWSQYEKTGDHSIEFDKQVNQKIRVVTVDTVSTVPVTKMFKINSANLANAQDARTQILNLVHDYTEIDRIEIVASSSTLRNKGEAENMTWKELSQARGQEVANIITGQNIDLGGEGVNIVGKISPEMIVINSNGTNGDGTSGPKSPYETNPQYVKSYQERGIDPKFWQSASKEDALPETEIDQYQQYQYVVIKIHGRIVETQTDDVPSYRYVSLDVRNMGGKMDVGTDKKDADVSKCSVKVKKNKMVDISSNPFLRK